MASIYTMVGNAFEALDKAYDEILNLNDKIEELLAESGGEVTAEIEQLQKELGSKQTAFEELKNEAAKDIDTKIDDYCAWHVNVVADIDPLKKQEQRLAKRRKAAERKAKWIEENILCGLNTLEKDKVSGKLFTASIRKSTATEVDETAALAPFNEAIDNFLAKLPSWLSFSPKFNKTLAKKEPVLPEGFSLVSNQSLSIK